jgi:hypothetical protein
MRMRSIALLTVVFAALAVTTAGVTAPPVDQVRGPACADITLSDPDQTGPPLYSTNRGTEPATVHALLTTDKPSCRGVTYTITVFDATGTTVLTSPTFEGDGATSAFTLTYMPPGAPSQVCIQATSARDGHVIDAAPNDACGVLVLDGGSPGGQGYF